MARGPYRRRPRLNVKDKRWAEGDVVIVNNVRWIIRRIHRTDVELEASNSRAKRIRWSTTLDCLPKKAGNQ